MSNFTTESYTFVTDTNDIDADHGPLSSEAYTFMGIYLAIMSIIALIGNGFVIYVFATLNHLKNQTNVLIINLAIADLLEAVAGYPLSIVSNFHNRWMFGDIGCQIYGSVCYLATLSNMCTFCVIGVYRYFYICYPDVNFLRSKGSTITVVIGIWVYSFFWASLPFIGWGKYGEEPFRTSCSLAWTNTEENTRSYLLSVFIFILFAPVAIILYMYAKIAKRIRTQISDISQVQPENSRVYNNNSVDGVRAIQGIDKHAEKVIIVSLTAYLVAWIPYGSMSFLSAVGINVPLYFTPIPTFFAKSQCAINPIIFALGFKDFREKVKGMFLCRSLD